jgi:hypothetical protein
MTSGFQALLVNLFIPLALIAVLAVVGRVSKRWRVPPTRFTTLLENAWAPAVLGSLTVLIVWFVWRSLSEPGVIHDERAYLLQAEIFARGHWTAPTPPIPAFFEQMHVFQEPAVFAKYPPGHALMLVPGVWLGLPGLMPALLAGVAGGLTFWLARRLTNIWTALLTWMLWTTAPATLIWATTYFSESTSAVMWLVAACATVCWLESGKGGHLLCATAALAWGFETRPLTAIALAAPLAFVIVRRTMEARRWRPLAAPLLAGAMILALGPLWNRQTLGNWLVDPYPYYSKAYFPFDKPGFGVDPAAPLRQVPPELIGMEEWSRAVHEAYVPAAVPSALVQRMAALLISYGTGWRLAIVVFLFASLIGVSGLTRLCIAACASLLAAHLVFAHPPEWIVYYAELLPILHFLAAGALMRLLATFHDGRTETTGQLSPSLARASVAATVILLPLCATDLLRVRAAIDQRNGFHRRAAQIVRDAPAHSILFVRYPSPHNPHFAVTGTDPDLSAARAWVVYDRGAENVRLEAIAPDRKSYVLELPTFHLEPLAPNSED